MGAGASKATQQPFDVTPENITAIKLCIHEGNIGQLRSLLSNTTKDFRQSLFEKTKELRGSVFLATRRKDLEMLKFLVKDCEASFEGINHLGFTPLLDTLDRGWKEGAMLLLKHGCDIRNSRVTRRQHLSCPEIQLIHLTVRSGSRTLLREVVERGGDISARDEFGDTCLFEMERSASPRFKTFVFQCVMDWFAKKARSGTVTEDDLLFALKSVFVCEEDPSKAEDILREQHPCPQARLWQVLGAWLVTRRDYEGATHCWRKAKQRVPGLLPDLSVEKDTAFRSVFEDLLHVDESQLLEGESFSDERKKAFFRQAVLVLERYHPKDFCLVRATMTVVTLLLDEDKATTALSLLQRLSTIWMEHPKKMCGILTGFRHTLEQMKDSDDVSFSMLLVSIEMTFRCFWFLRKGVQLDMHGVTECADSFCPSTCLCVSFVISYHLFPVFLSIFAIFFKCEVSATPEQMETFLLQIKKFVFDFPALFNHSFFPALVREQPEHLTSLLKILAPFIAEAKDKNPPKDWACIHGATPLHVIASDLSKEQLVEEGVLQCFLEHKPDLCTRDSEGDSVRDILVRRGIFTPGDRLPSLKCLAAKAFMRNDELKGRVHDCPVTAVKRFLMDHR